MDRDFDRNILLSIMHFLFAVVTLLLAATSYTTAASGPSLTLQVSGDSRQTKM